MTEQELQAKIEKLEQQLEKMKCCGNCKHLKYHEYALDKYECVFYNVGNILGARVCDEWELAA